MDQDVSELDENEMFVGNASIYFFWSATGDRTVTGPVTGPATGPGPGRAGDR